MSDSTNKVPIVVAKRVAENLLEAMAGSFIRAEIAGSIRREVPWVSDIEIVVIPKPSEDLFSNLHYNSDVVYRAIQGDMDMLNPPAFEKQGTAYGRFQFQGIDVDLFITTPEKWGCIFLIRTGSADFTRHIVTQRWQGGWCPPDLYFKYGRLWSIEQSVPLYTPEEEDVFRHLGLDWIEPYGRI